MGGSVFGLALPFFYLSGSLHNDGNDHCSTVKGDNMKEVLTEISLMVIGLMIVFGLRMLYLKYFEKDRQ
jgi:hypothetical protein